MDQTTAVSLGQCRGRRRSSSSSRRLSEHQHIPLDICQELGADHENHTSSGGMEGDVLVRKNLDAVVVYGEMFFLLLLTWLSVMICCKRGSRGKDLGRLGKRCSFSRIHLNVQF